ncbi:hypothetical protein BT69DRAFT_1293661 [Atractiella rhizophila]|nr:hypothetical protein BT69DRAFT_1293661 [Atractiella rhizophila]
MADKINSWSKAADVARPAIIEFVAIHAKWVREAKLARLTLNKQPRFNAHPSVLHQQDPHEVAETTTSMVLSGPPSSKVVTGTSGRNKPQKSTKRNSTSVDHGGKRRGGTSAKVGQGGRQGMSPKRGSGGAGRGESSKEDRHPRKKRGITDVDVLEETSSESEGEKRVKEKKTLATKKRKTEGKKRVGKKLVNMDWKEALWSAIFILIGLADHETSKDGTIKHPFSFMSPHLGANSTAGGSQWNMAASVYISLQTYHLGPTLLVVQIWISAIGRASKETCVIPGNNQFTCKWSRLHRQLEDLPPALRQARFSKEAVKSIFYKKKANQSVSKCYDWHTNLEWYPGHTSIITQKPPKLDPTMTKVTEKDHRQKSFSTTANRKQQIRNGALVKLEGSPSQSSGLVMKYAAPVLVGKLTMRTEFMPDWNKPDEEKMLDVETIKADGRDALPNKHSFTP